MLGQYLERLILSIDKAIYQRCRWFVNFTFKLPSDNVSKRTSPFQQKTPREKRRMGNKEANANRHCLSSQRTQGVVAHYIVISNNIRNKCAHGTQPFHEEAHTRNTSYLALLDPYAVYILVHKVLFYVPCDKFSTAFYFFL